VILTIKDKTFDNPRVVVQAALLRANALYNDNLVVHETWHRARRIRFVLRTKDSRAYGSRTSWSGRHTRSASWEAHRDFMRFIFDLDPNARLQTGMATYNGKRGFEVHHGDTARRNIGSHMQPCTMPDCTV
jgi:hypothetical protein